MVKGDTRIPRLMALSDLVARWTYTRQGVIKLIQRDDSFPKEAGTVCGGRVRLWLEADIEAYELDMPRLKKPPR